MIQTVASIFSFSWRAVLWKWNNTSLSDKWTPFATESKFLKRKDQEKTYRS